SGRTEFTRQDDHFLVQYIAKYRPTPEGRLGNTLYKTLCEDVDRAWKWSKRHPWQSWRNRYQKNQSEFDAKILVHQRKLAEKAAAEGKGEAGPSKTGKKRQAEEAAEGSGKREKRAKASPLVKEEPRAETAARTKEAQAPLPPVERARPPSSAPEASGSEEQSSEDQKPVHSDDYDRELFGSSSDERKEDDDEQLRSEYEPVYPDPAMLPSPGLTPLASKRGVDRRATSTPRRPDFPPNEVAENVKVAEQEKQNPPKEVPSRRKEEKKGFPAKPSFMTKPKPKRRVVDNDPFVSTASENESTRSSPPLQPTRRKRVLKEGPFRTAWGKPPQRSPAKQAEPPSVPNASHPPPHRESRPDPQMNGLPTKPQELRAMAKEKARSPADKPLPRRSIGRVVTTQASSSRVQLPPGRQTLDEVLSSAGANAQRPPPAAGAVPSSKQMDKVRPSAQRINGQTDARRTPSTLNQPRSPQSISETVRRARHPPQHSGKESRSGSGAVITGASATLVNDSGEVDDRPVRIDDLFDNQKPLAAPAERVNYAMLAIPPHIDLSNKTKNRSAGTPRSSSHSSKNAQFNNPPPPTPLAASIARHIVKDLADKYRFPEHVVWQAFVKFQNLDKVAECLHDAREQADAIAADLAIKSINGGDEQDEEEGSLFDIRRVQPRPSWNTDTRQLGTYSTNHSRHTTASTNSNTDLVDLSMLSKQSGLGRSSRRRSKARLEIRPSDVGQFPDVYEPPRSTRARRYSKMVDAGEVEALDLEASSPPKHSTPKVDLKTRSVTKEEEKRPSRRSSAQARSSEDEEEGLPPSSPEAQESPLVRARKRRVGKEEESPVPPSPTLEREAYYGGRRSYGDSDDDEEGEDEYQASGEEGAREEDGVDEGWDARVLQGEGDDENGDNESQSQESGDGEQPYDNEAGAGDVEMEGVEDDEENDRQDADMDMGRRSDPDSVEEVAVKLLSSPALESDSTDDREASPSTFDQADWEALTKAHDELTDQVDADDHAEMDEFVKRVGNPDTMRALAVQRLIGFLEAGVAGEAGLD
ncbi:hypothetical protein BKA70DRAFT_1527711, partial [Coprinopsis sp. MPI-PUGE-AT-0042]